MYFYARGDLVQERGKSITSLSLSLVRVEEKPARSISRFAGFATALASSRIARIFCIAPATADPWRKSISKRMQFHFVNTNRITQYLTVPYRYSSFIIESGREGERGENQR